MGLMQIIPSTGQSLAEELGLENAGILGQELFNPTLNVQLASHYIRKLKMRFDNDFTSIFAAYNAGEDAVSIWRKRRWHENSLLWLELIPFGETRSY